MLQLRSVKLSARLRSPTTHTLDVNVLYQADRSKLQVVDPPLPEQTHYNVLYGNLIPRYSVSPRRQNLTILGKVNKVSWKCLLGRGHRAAAGVRADRLKATTAHWGSRSESNRTTAAAQDPGTKFLTVTY